MRSQIAFIGVLIASTAALDSASAQIRFVAPLGGSQTIGVQPIEVSVYVPAVDRVEFFVDDVLAGVARKPPYRVAHDFGESLASHTIEARVSSDGYRSTTSVRIETAALTAGEVLSVDLVEVPLRIQSSRRVGPADLRVRENGIEQQPRDLRPQRGGARFVFVIDRSLSMGGGRLTSALRAVDAVIPMLRSDDRVEAVLFNHNVSPPKLLAANERLANTFRSTVPSGGTSLRDAMTEIHSEGATYVIVITDGGDRNSRTTEDQALRSLSGARSVVGAVVLGSDSRFLDKAAANTGGVVRHASAESLHDALRAIISDINSRYLLVYQSHGNASGRRRIEVGTRNRGVAVTNARKEYFAQ